MKVYLVSYDLNTPGKNYDGLYDLLNSYHDCCHILKSEWFVACNDSAREISNAIKGVTDASDRWLVNEINSAYSGWLSKDAWEWLAKYT